MIPEIEPEIEVGHLEAKDIWREKERYAELEPKSKEYWDKMPDENRAAILDIIQRAMERMKQNVASWVPYSLQPSSGEYVQVSFRVVFSDIDEEVLRREAADRAAFELAREQVKELVDLEEQDGR